MPVEGQLSDSMKMSDFYMAKFYIQHFVSSLGSWAKYINKLLAKIPPKVCCLIDVCTHILSIQSGLSSAAYIEYGMEYGKV